MSGNSELIRRGFEAFEPVWDRLTLDAEGVLRQRWFDTAAEALDAAGIRRG